MILEVQCSFCHKWIFIRHHDDISNNMPLCEVCKKQYRKRFDWLLLMGIWFFVILILFIVGESC